MADPSIDRIFFVPGYEEYAIYDPRADQACEETDRQKQVLAENRNLKAWMHMVYTVIRRLNQKKYLRRIAALPSEC